MLLADKAHMAVKREAVRQLPRLWSLKRLLGLAEVTPQKTEPAMVHLSTAHASGSPAVFTTPPGNLHVNLDHPYVRQSSQPSSTGAAAGSTGQQGEATLLRCQESLLHTTVLESLRDLSNAINAEKYNCQLLMQD